MSSPDQIFKSQYGYNDYEIVMMFLITGGTNICAILGLLISMKQKDVHRIFVVIFLMLSSFMYHSLDSFGMERFYLKKSQWHKLDNIASICGIIEVIIYLMQTSKQATLYLQGFSMYLVFIIQEDYAWDIRFTIAPIFFFLFILTTHRTIQRKQKRTKINTQILNRGITFLIIATFFFYLGLDEYKDYLRLFHGMWHILASTFTFYLMQLYENNTYEVWQPNKLFKEQLNIAKKHKFFAIEESQDINENIKIENQQKTIILQHENELERISQSDIIDIQTII